MVKTVVGDGLTVPPLFFFIFQLEKNNIPVGGNNIPVGGNNIPVGGNNIPVGGNNIPVGGNSIPVGGNNIPVGESLILQVFILKYAGQLTRRVAG